MKIIDYIKRDWIQLKDRITRVPSKADEYADRRLAEITSLAMKEKLSICREKGRSGWYSNECSIEILKEMLYEHLYKGDMIDVINISAMIYYRDCAGIDNQQ